MKNFKRANVLGLVLIILGALLFLNNQGYINLNYYNLKPYLDRIIELWPLFLIIIGTFLVTKNRAKRILAIIISILIVFLYINYGPNFLFELKNAIKYGSSGF